MIMIVKMPEDMNSFHQVQEEIEALGEPEHLKIHVMHEDIFNAMHTV